MKIMQGGIGALNKIEANTVLLNTFDNMHQVFYAPIDMLEYAPYMKDIMSWTYAKVKASKKVIWFIRFPQSSSEATYVLMNMLCTLARRFISEDGEDDTKLFSGVTLIIENDKEYIFDYLSRNMPGAKMLD